MRVWRFVVVALLGAGLMACDPKAEPRDLSQMGLASPGRTADNQWVVGAMTLDPAIAGAEARLQVTRGNCRLITLPGDPPVAPGAASAPHGMIIVGDAPDTPATAPLRARAQAYGAAYNTVVLAGCTPR